MSRYRFVPDPLGSVRALLDTSGSIVATRDYWPYGEVAAQSGGMTAIQFVGALGYFTDATGRIYVRARHYRPDLGRWVTVDPIGVEEGNSALYLYTRAHPMTLRDPSGLQAMWSQCGAAWRAGWAESRQGKVVGGVICVHGRKVPCCWPQNLPGGVTPRVQDCFCACVIEHERTHFDDVQCPGDRFCRPGWSRPEEEWAFEECSAYVTEISCLRRSMFACCGPLGLPEMTLCSVQIGALFCDTCKWAREKCRAAGMGYPQRLCDRFCGQGAMR